MKNKTKISYFINHANFFYSHRFPIAKKAVEKGYSVSLIVGQEGDKSNEDKIERKILDERIKIYRSFFTASGLNIFKELFGFFYSLITIMRIKPNIMHCASPKGCLYGGLISRIIGTKSLVLSISGMGYIFTEKKDNNYLRKVLRSIYVLFFRVVLNHKNMIVIVQNDNDKDFLQSQFNLKDSSIVQIKGSGVNLDLYKGIDFSKKKNQVLMASRPLYKKGTIDYFKAAKKLKEFFPDWHFCFAGSLKYDSPDTIPIGIIEKWKNEDAIEILGYVENIQDLYIESSIVCLPSYREGFPKTLMEAAASGNAVVTSDVIGCRDAIIADHTGLLIEAGNIEELFEAIKRLIKEKDLRIDFARNGMTLAKNKFSLDVVVERNLDIYDKLLAR